MRPSLSTARHRAARSGKLRVAIAAAAVAGLIGSVVLATTSAGASASGVGGTSIGTTLGVNQSLVGGQKMVSPNGAYAAVIQTDGNFVVYGPSGVKYASSTSGAHAFLAMQSDGNLVIYAGGKALWATHTEGPGRTAVTASLQNDGNFVVRNNTVALWSTLTGPIKQAPTPPAPIVIGGTSLGATLVTNATLSVGQKLVSPNGVYTAVPQSDGNFVIYSPTAPIFATGTRGAGVVLQIQGDGNLVLRNSASTPIFNTGTFGPNATVSMQDDGNLVVRTGTRPLWSSKGGLIPTPHFAGTGDFRVGTNIAAGTYRTRTNNANCYWERDSGFSGSVSDIIANNLTDFHDVVTILPSDKGFSTDACGTWTQDLRPITSSPVASFGDGTWIVNTDIAPGTWTAPGGANCYWERDNAFSHEDADIIANDLGATTPTVTIAGSDAGFQSLACGTWTKIG